MRLAEKLGWKGLTDLGYKDSISESILSRSSLYTSCDITLIECELLRKERNALKTNVLKTNVWPISKSEPIRKHFKAFFKFTNEISFDKLTNSDPPRGLTDYKL